MRPREVILFLVVLGISLDLSLGAVSIYSPFLNLMLRVYRECLGKKESRRLENNIFNNIGPILQFDFLFTDLMVRALSSQAGGPVRFSVPVPRETDI